MLCLSRSARRFISSISWVARTLASSRSCRRSMSFTDSSRVSKRHRNVTWWGSLFPRCLTFLDLLHSLGFLLRLIFLRTATIGVFIIILAMTLETLHLLLLPRFLLTARLSFGSIDSFGCSVWLGGWLIVKEFLSLILIESVLIVVQALRRCRRFVVGGLGQVVQLLPVCLSGLEMILTAGIAHPRKYMII